MQKYNNISVAMIETVPDALIMPISAKASQVINHT